MHIQDTMPSILRKMPPSVFTKKSFLSFYFLGRDILLAIIFIAGILYVDSWYLGFFLSIFLGMTLMGLFVLGHDAGHRSFSKHESVNNFIGHITTSFCLWPFHVWRLSHDLHHRHTHNLDKEIAWRPLTIKQYLRRSAFDRWFYRATRSYMMSISSIVFTSYFIRDALLGRRSKFFDQKDMPQLRRSIIICLAVTVSVIFTSYEVAGLYGLIYLFVLPQIVFQTLLSVFTFFHHTSPDRTLYPNVHWTMEKGQLGGTIHVKYPAIIEWFCHDINWHVPHHVCVGIPHYHLRLAHKNLKNAYPELVKEVDLSVKTWVDVTSKCHLVVGKKPGQETWVSFDQVKNYQERLAEAPAQ